MGSDYGARTPYRIWSRRAPRAVGAGPLPLSSNGFPQNKAQEQAESTGMRNRVLHHREGLGMVCQSMM